jgi:hypothetical protein
MAFLTKSDLLAYIDEAELDEIIDNDDANLTRPMADAEARIRGKLNHRYDTTVIFAAPSNSAYSNVKKIGVDIALFYIYDSVQVRHIPENKLANFQRAEEDLFQLATGEWDNDLPKITLADDEDEYSGEGFAAYDDFIPTNLY